MSASIRSAATREDLGAVLTPKEQACLRLVAQHLSSKDIALALGIAKTTVDTYCDRARRKLGVADRYEAARRLIAHLGPGDAARAPPEGSAVIPLTAAAPARPRSPGPWAVAALALAAIVALATLLSGLRAIDEVTTPARVQATR